MSDEFDEYDAGIITRYVEEQAHEKVVHVERASTEMVGRHDVWDVHCTESRWWVVTNPTHLYTQEDFKSRAVVLTFHMGLTLRMADTRERAVPVTPPAARAAPSAGMRRRISRPSGSDYASALRRSSERPRAMTLFRVARRHPRVRTSKVGRRC